MHINVTHIPVEYAIAEDSWEMECQHVSTHIEEAVQNYMTFDGPDQRSYDIIVCDECDAYYNDVDEQWVNIHED